MSALLDLHPDAGHPVLAGLGAIEDALDQIHGAATTPLASGEYAAAVRRIECISRRLDAAKLKVVAAADKAGAPEDAGFTGTEAWVAKNTTTSRTTATREVGLARDLGSGEHDTTAAALDQGLVSPDHAAVILDAERRLPEGVSAEQRQRVEESLVEKAQKYSPERLRREARRAIEAIEPDEAVVDAAEDEQLRSEEEVARSKAKLWFRDNGDGTTTGAFTVPTPSAGFLRKIIESMTAPRRMRAARVGRPGFETVADAPSSTSGTAGAPASTSATAGAPSSTSGAGVGEPAARLYDWDHRRGLAFADLLEHLPTDHLHEKTAATVVVTISHTVLQDALKAAHLDTGQTISAGEARRLACNAGIIPAVLGTNSVALDLGRETRLFSQAQRIAAGLRHDTCAADGCDRPYAWCELHHREPWSLGGRTDLRDAVPLCHWHHQRIHDRGFDHRYLPDGTIRFSRRT